MKMRYKFLFVFLAISLAGFLTVYVFWPKGDKLPILEKVESFTLDDVHGDVYQSNNKKIKLVSFFYTNCPDVCPLTMVDFQMLQDSLKKEGLFSEQVELISITLDPDHDSEHVIQTYAQSFDADPRGWKWLRGTNLQIKQVADEFQMQYQKLEGDFYTHSITMYLVDGDNQIRGLYDMANTKKPVEKERILADIQQLVK